MNRFYELGGEAWFNCRAEEFLFDGDRVCGVRTNLGDVECRQVLASINPNMIYANMMPKELVPEREKKLAAARKGKFSTKFCMIYFALNKTCEELGLTDYCVFFAGTADSRKEYNNIKSIDNDYNILISYNNLIPDFSPRGHLRHQLYNALQLRRGLGHDCAGGLLQGQGQDDRQVHRRSQKEAQHRHHAVHRGS